MLSFSGVFENKIDNFIVVQARPSAALNLKSRVKI